jgi:hypothetical protein
MPKRVKRRQFRVENVQEFLFLLNQGTQQEACVETDVNAEFRSLLDVFHFHYENACPLKTVYLREVTYKKPGKNAVTQGIADSTQFKINYVLK